LGGRLHIHGDESDGAEHDTVFDFCDDLTRSVSVNRGLGQHRHYQRA
jgi:hypothetical protein